jgi:hypothetical protein
MVVEVIGEMGYLKRMCSTKEKGVKRKPYVILSF